MIDRKYDGSKIIENGQLTIIIGVSEMSKEDETQSKPQRLIMKPLVWTDERKPNDECRYNHCIADTPFGRFLLTWKGWKENKSDSMGFDETPWGDIWYGYWGAVEEAQKDAEDMLLEKIRLMMA